MSGKKIVVAGLSAGIAFAALTGCTQPATQPGATAPISTPSTSASAPADTAPDSPTTPPTTSPSSSTAKPKPTKTAAGQGGSGQARDGWGGVNFNKLLFRTLGCVDNAEAKGKAALYSVTRADVTGDGAKEAVVAGSCTPLSGPDHAYVLVFDGAKAGNDPVTLVQIGKGQDLTTANVQVRGRQITVSSKALSKDAPLCCPDLKITQTWEGNRDGDFVRTSLTTKHVQG